MKSLNLKSKVDDAGIDIDDLFKKSPLNKFVQLFPFGEKLIDWYYNIKLFIKSNYQKLTVGVSDKECWNLPETFAGYILPRLIHFRKMKRYTYPAQLTEEKWEEILDELIWTFDYIKNPEKYNPFPSIDVGLFSNIIEKNYWDDYPEEKEMFNKYFKNSEILEKRKKEGLELFVKYYDSLWD